MKFPAQGYISRKWQSKSLLREFDSTACILNHYATSSLQRSAISHDIIFNTEFPRKGSVVTTAFQTSTVLGVCVGTMQKQNKSSMNFALMIVSILRLSGHGSMILNDFGKCLLNLFLVCYLCFIMVLFFQNIASEGKAQAIVLSESLITVPCKHQFSKCCLREMKDVYKMPVNCLPSASSVVHTWLPIR